MDYRDILNKIDDLRRQVEELARIEVAPPTTIADNSITNAKLRASGALSVVGRSANSSGNVADISASAASDAVLRESGSVIGFGTIATGGIANDAVSNTKLANMAEATIKGRQAATGTGDPEDLTAAQASKIVHSVGLNTDWDLGEDRAILTEKFAARDNEGILIYDDGGNLIARLKDGGTSEFGPGATGANTATLAVIPASGTPAVFRADASAAGTAQYAVASVLSDGGRIEFISWGSTFSGTRYGQAIADSGEFITFGLSRILFGSNDAAPIIFGTNATLAGTISTTQDWGFGTASPQGKLHAHDGTGGFLFVTKTGVVGSEIDLIPNGTGDVVRGCYYYGVVRGSTSGFLGVIANSIATPGSGSTQSTIAGNVAVKLYSTGQFVVFRVSGSETWTVTLTIVWQ